MRVRLTGSGPERDRIRRALELAGIVVVDETPFEPDASTGARDVDAVVTVSGADIPARRPLDDPDAIVEEPLTAREHEVLGLLAEGLSNKRIAAALGISDQTAKFHVAAILAKLGAANRTEAVRVALRRGLVTI